MTWPNVFGDWLCRQQANIHKTSDRHGVDVWRSFVFICGLCKVRNNDIWTAVTIDAPIEESFWCLFPSGRHSEDKHHNNFQGRMNSSSLHAEHHSLYLSIQNSIHIELHGYWIYELLIPASGDKYCGFYSRKSYSIFVHSAQYYASVRIDWFIDILRNRFRFFFRCHVIGISKNENLPPHDTPGYHATTNISKNTAAFLVWIGNRIYKNIVCNFSCLQ